MKELTLECSNERIRIGVATLIVHVLKTLSPYEHLFFTEYVEVKQQKKDTEETVKIPM